ncbi:MAG TPA: hypothetical protein VFW45_14960 [Candidatus Polarisedimenticolia bacterium]|nr:hypothetical protein [Candidatus Polarisedimenticolia bacterium]
MQPRRFPASWLAVLVAGLLIPTSGARAQDVSGYAELAASRDRTHLVDGGVTDVLSDSFLQRYSVDFLWRLYPNLQVMAGGLYERDFTEASLNDVDLETLQRKVRPYVTATLRTPIQSASVGWYRNEDTFRSDGSSLGAVQEIVNATLGWRPERFPQTTLRFLRTHDYDPDRVIQDTNTDLLDLVLEDEVKDSVHIYYRGALEEIDDRINDFQLNRISHSGRVDYGDSWWDQRLQVGGEYDIHKTSEEVTSSGGGEVLTPLFPIGGLSGLDDTPADGFLAATPALIDEDRIAGVGLDLGLPPIGGDVRPRNLGLDFGATTRVNTLFVWVDRDLPAAVSGSFSWELYTSADNVTWQLEQTIFPALFGPFVTRFEIRFTAVDARYVKLAVRPLAASVPNATQFPNIFITELQAAVRTAAADATGRNELTTQLLTTSLRLRLTDRPAVTYEFSAFGRKIEDFPVYGTISNGFSLHHVFNPVYSTMARVAREDSHESDGDRTTYLYTASLRAVPLSTLESTLVFSGRSSEHEGLPSDSAGVRWTTQAELYRGISARLGLGRSAVLTEDGERTEMREVDVLTTLDPHPAVTLSLLVQDDSGNRQGGHLVEEVPVERQAEEAGVTFRPFATLYMFFSYRRDRENSLPVRFTRSSSASWAPFPDGRLQILFRFDDSYRSDLEAESRIFSPRVRWNVTDRWYLEAAYESAEFNSALDDRSSDIVTFSTRIWF